MKKFCIKTLGCKVNQYESEALASQLAGAGLRPLETDTDADVCIVNTCSVTHKAAMQSRQAVRQAIRANPNARIIVTGCHAETHREEFERIAGVDCIVGQAVKHTIPELAQSGAQAAAQRPHCVGAGLDRATPFSPLTAVSYDSRTRPFLKIQDGCDAFCTYCIVPYARGRSRSMPVADVLAHVAAIGAAGFHEVVLTGIHIGCYGLDLEPPTRLTTLLQRLRAAGAVDRLRLSSIEPGELGDDLIALAAESPDGAGRLCDHFHVPLQSGDDGILARMHRPYTRAVFRERVLAVRAALPHAAIGVDVLIGFPGETRAAFENTRDLIAELPVTYLHVFPFSPRAGTPASRYPDPVDPAEIKVRCRIMRDLGVLKKRRFFRDQVGRRASALIETVDPATGRAKGLTSNYIPVHLDAPVVPNTLVPVRLEAVRGNAMRGIPLV